MPFFLILIIVYMYFLKKNFQRLNFQIILPKLPEDFFMSFYNLMEITLPRTLLSLPNNCFQDCVQLQELVIPPNVYEIGFSCFEECTILEKVSIPSKSCISSEKIRTIEALGTELNIC
tara:strand:+ start:257 stop:610 length:354 start_codon:yes stop_codon:yes gene_type:complete